jgi:DNA-binding transcriptional ArsR family regulator
MSEIFSVLSDPTRRSILLALAKKSQTVTDLVAITGEGQPTVSKHLKTLRDAGLVSVKAAGQARVYSISTAPLAEATKFLTKLDPTNAGKAQARAAESEGDLPKILGEAGEKLGGLLAAGATWLNAQVAAKLAEADVDPNKIGKDLGRKLADAKLVATDTATSAEEQFRNEITELTNKLGAKVAEVKESVLPSKKPAKTEAAAKPAAKKAAAKNAPAKKPASKTPAAK